MMDEQRSALMERLGTWLCVHTRAHDRPPPPSPLPLLLLLLLLLPPLLLLLWLRLLLLLLPPLLPRLLVVSNVSGGCHADAAGIKMKLTASCQQAAGCYLQFYSCFAGVQTVRGRRATRGMAIQQ